MKIRVHISPVLYKNNRVPLVAEVQGSTVGECLKSLVRQFPIIEKDVFDEEGMLNVNIFFRGALVHDAGLTQPVKDGDDIYIVHMLEGG